MILIEKFCQRQMEKVNLSPYVLVIVVITSFGPQTEAKETSKEVPAVFVDFKNINLCL